MTDYPTTPVHEWPEADCIRLYDDLVMKHPNKVPHRIKLKMTFKTMTAKEAIMEVRARLSADATANPGSRKAGIPLAYSSLVRIVAEILRVHPDMLAETTRTPRVTRAREFVAYIAHTHYGHSYPTIMRAMRPTVRGHSTVITAVNRLVFDMAQGMKLEVQIGDRIQNWTIEQIVEHVLGRMSFRAEEYMVLDK